MKTIAVLYERENVENYYKPKDIIKVICKETTEEEHNEIRNGYLGNIEYNKSLSICHWLEDKEADDIVDNTFLTMQNNLFMLVRAEKERKLTEDEKKTYVHIYEIFKEHSIHIPFGVTI